MKNKNISTNKIDYIKVEKYEQKAKRKSFKYSCTNMYGNNFSDFYTNNNVYERYISLFNKYKWN